MYFWVCLIVQNISGNDNIEEIPVPILNTEVKLKCADNTERSLLKIGFCCQVYIPVSSKLVERSAEAAHEKRTKTRCA